MLAPHATADATRAPSLATSLSPTPTLANVPVGGKVTVGVVGNFNGDVNALPNIVQSALFDSLLQIDPTNGALKPALAESYQVSEDARTITFRLRADVRFHNGNLLTADDVVATLTAFSAPTFRGTPLTDFGTFTRATALDARTVQLAFSEAYCPALASIGTLKILPRAVATSANFPRLTNAQLIGTGPFKLATRSNSEFILERHNDYFRGAPYLDSLSVRVYADARALREAFVSRQIDVMPATADDYTPLQKLGASLSTSDANEFIALLFNLDTPALNDPRVRQALTYALDRQVLLNDVHQQARLINTSALPEFWAYPSNLPSYSFNPPLARQLLADAGWQVGSDGVLRQNNRPLRLELWTEADDALLEPLAFRVREMYAALGVQIELDLSDRTGWMTRAFQHRFDLLLLRRKIPLDLDQRWYWQSDQNVKGSGFNFGSYSNARVDALLQSALRVPRCDMMTRAALFGEWQRALIPDAPVVFLFAPKKYLVARENVLNLAPSPFAGDFWNLHTWGVR
jgi:peptide/nickel transport system substrate-binding protein